MIIGGRCDFPCAGCQQRHESCHSTCAEYKDAASRHGERRRAERSERSAYNYKYGKVVDGLDAQSIRRKQGRHHVI